MNGMKPTDVIIALKHALTQIKRETGVPIEDIEVTLQAQADNESGFSLKIPFLSDLGIGASARETVTQTLYFKFSLPDTSHELLPSPAETVERSVSDGMTAFREAVTVAYDGELGRPLTLKEGWSEINFVFNIEGKIELVFNAALKQLVGNTIRISYSPPTL